MKMSTKDETIKNLRKRITELEDENESLWAMMDEMAESDIENRADLIEQLKMDVVARALMTSKEKVEA
jgi:hypothetical protein